jgi:hypothetical protein
MQASINAKVFTIINIWGIKVQVVDPRCRETVDLRYKGTIEVWDGLIYPPHHLPPPFIPPNLVSRLPASFRESFEECKSERERETSTVRVEKES